MNTQNVNVKTAAQESSRKMGGNQRLNNILSVELPVMRGLAVRVEWGKARVMRCIDQEKAGIEEVFSLIDAECEGRQDFRNGDVTPPHMFSDVPELIGAWKQGWRLTAESYEMTCCEACNNDTGEPCPYHD
ncbi:hypothetical protein [Kluyvera sichuanensis]|uniref:hypothetical protein n=1 Tax=Kluyvera sichuanensis TaxID=2725494 RepID=UPI0039F51A4E